MPQDLAGVAGDAVVDCVLQVGGAVEGVENVADRDHAADRARGAVDAGSANDTPAVGHRRGGHVAGV